MSLVRAYSAPPLTKGRLGGVAVTPFSTNGGYDIIPPLTKGRPGRVLSGITSPGPSLVRRGDKKGVLGKEGGYGRVDDEGF